MSRVTRPGHLDRDPAGDQLHGRGHLGGVHVVEQDQVGAGPSATFTWSRVSHSTSTARPGQRRWASATAASMEMPARWLSLSRMPSESEPRWLTPPPARTAAFSRARKPGVVLRVSRMRVVGAGRVDEPPGQGGDAREVAEEVEGGPLGGEDRRQRSLDPGQHLPGVDPVAVGRGPPHRDGGVDGGERLGRGQPAGQHAWRPGHQRRRVTVALGRHQAGGHVAEHTEILGQGPGHDVADRRHRRIQPGRRHCTNLCEKTSDVAGKSSRRCPPRLSSRAVAAAIKARATSTRLASSPGAGRHGGDLVRGRGASEAAVRTTPAPAVMARCSSSRPLTGSAGLLADPRGGRGGREPAHADLPRLGRRPGRRTGRRAPVGPGPSLPESTASTARAPNTMPSSSEFEASRLAPWTPVHGHLAGRPQAGQGGGPVEIGQDAAAQVVSRRRHGQPVPDRVEAQVAHRPPPASGTGLAKSSTARDVQPHVVDAVLARCGRATAAATTSRGCISSTKRWPRWSRSRAPSPRRASLSSGRGPAVDPCRAVG